MRDFSRPTPAILHSRRSLRCSLILRAQALSTDNRQKSLLNALSNHRPNANDLVDFPGPSPHFFGGKFSDFTRCVSCYIYLCVRFTTSIICRCLQKQGDQFESLRPLHFDGNPDTSVVSGFLVSISHDLVRTKTPITPTFRHHAEPTGPTSPAPFCFTAFRDQTRPGLCLWATRFSRQSEPPSDRLKAFAAFCVWPGLAVNSSPSAPLFDSSCFAWLVLLLCGLAFRGALLPEGHWRRERLARDKISSVLASENPSASPARPFSPVPRPRFTAPLSVAPISPRCLLLSRNRSATPFPHATPPP